MFKKFYLPASIVMGIPTIKRERNSYLLQTLESLLGGLNDEEKQEVLIVVFIAEVTLTVTVFSYPQFYLKH